VAVVKTIGFNVLERVVVKYAGPWIAKLWKRFVSGAKEEEERTGDVEAGEQDPGQVAILMETDL
jgi:hypothetical protein